MALHSTGGGLEGVVGVRFLSWPLTDKHIEKGVFF